MAAYPPNLKVKRTYRTGTPDFLKTTVNQSVEDDEGIDIHCATNNTVLIGLKHPTKLYFQGILEMKCLAGQVSVLGYEFTPEKRQTVLYSMEGDSSLDIEVSEDTKVSEDFQISSLLKYGLQFMRATQFVNRVRDCGAIILLSYPSDARYPKWKTNLKKNGYDLLPTLTDENAAKHELILNCLLDWGHGKLKNKFKIEKSWPALFTKLMTCNQPHKGFSNIKVSGQRIALCGGKSVGKSSLLRYFVNNALNQHKKVLIVDFDVGQCEFTIPGCISIIVVDKPITGPNYCHFIKPVRSFYLGQVDASKCSNLYIESVEKIMDFCRSLEEFSGIPWFANTMGFCRGFGVTLNAAVLANFMPTHLVQIQSKHHQNNFPQILTKNVIDKSYTGKHDFSYEVETIDSVVEDLPEIQGKTFKSYDKRNIAILSYLYREFLEGATTCILPRAHVYIMFCGKDVSVNNDSMLAVGDLIVLSDSSVDDGITNILGFGILEAYEVGYEEIRVKAVIEASDIPNIKGLILGSIKVPDTVLRSDPNLMGTIPYFSLRTISRDNTRRHTKCLFHKSN